MSPRFPLPIAIMIAAATLLAAPWLLSASQAAPAPAPTDPREARVELGRRLFFDPLLSGDRTVSCASCHKPEHAFADTVVISPGVSGRLVCATRPRS